jgi:hypothetical protein
VTRLKSALPRRRYVVLFASRLCYFAECKVRLPPGDPGVTLNAFNTVVDIDEGSAAVGLLELGDVLTEVDGIVVAGEQVYWGATRKHKVKLIRQRGFVPLLPGTRVAACRALFNRVSRDASAFEVIVDLNADQQKTRYVFICPDGVEAARWREAISQHCPPLPEGGAQAGTRAHALVRARTADI